ncbi:MAG: thrombospondin type 3 repeat-containing protein, partial [Anaerolineae bacterium]|nr:thrombospondin type 3 repeat-containing protein [Anaerolineae bacterium]
MQLGRLKLTPQNLAIIGVVLAVLVAGVIIFAEDLGLSGTSADLTDTDGDGLHDRIDKCPNEVGPIDNRGCPVETADNGSIDPNSNLAQGDNDGDGIKNIDDKCPLRGDEGNGIDADGCPIEVGAGGQPTADDSDGDGVPNDVDACPNDGDAGWGVDTQGCPFYDSDGDGVFDHADACPNAGDEGNGVAPNGCPNPAGVAQNPNDGRVDKASLTVSAQCGDGEVIFIITNTGDAGAEGRMAVGTAWNFLVDEVSQQTGTTQVLDGKASQTLTFPLQPGSHKYRLIVDQPQGHPGTGITQADTTCAGDDQPPTDVCPNIPDVQVEIPDGLIMDDNGDCVEPPTDVCPNI